MSEGKVSTDKVGPKTGAATPGTQKHKYPSAIATVLITFAIVVGGLYLAWEGTSSAFKSLVLVSIEVALHGKNDNYLVQGELGGVPVAIPRKVIRNVEYDDENLYREKRKALPDEKTRTAKDKLASFGFEAHFPDMELETAEVMKREEGKSNIHNTMWIHVGITSNSHLAGGGLGLERRIKYIPTDLNYRGPDFQYRRQPELVHGLIAHYPMQRVVSPQGEVSWQPVEDDSIYYHLDENGKVDTYIKCSYVKYGSSQCKQSFLLLPQMLTMVNVSYRNGLLPHWQEIQSSVGKVVLGFVVDKPAGQAQQ